MIRTCLGRLAAVAALALVYPLHAQSPDAKGVEFFEKKIRPVLVEKCYSCHSDAPGAKVRGDLRLDTRAGLLRGGSNGPVVVPGAPEKSTLLQAVHQQGDLKMPPKEKLTREQITDLEAWVKMGAPDPRDGKVVAGIDLEKGRQFWAFQPLRASPVPVTKSGTAFNAIDRFILAEQEKRGLKPADLADRRTLLRRLTYDLTGLPATPDEIEDFVNDPTPGAYSRVVERLLASPAYGQRWGRHWLDVVRYADTAGDNSDYPIPQHFRYRDWVIDAINADVPYDRFVREQLAGDLMTEGTREEKLRRLIATGYLANTRRFGSYEDKRYQWYLTYEDSIENLGRAFLGLSLGCARCHDHKFDPIPQTDYYALYGFFSSTRYPWPGIELDKVQRDLVPLAPPEEVSLWESEQRKKLAALDATVRELEAAKSSPDDIKKAKAQRDALAKQPPPYELIYAMAEHPADSKKKAGNACVQMKGDPDHPGAEVPRRFPLILGGQELPAGTPGSGRLHLARWLTDAKNPLFARVMVNRIWLGHFGRGLVPTPNDFGKMGQPPSHPELLDYLARRFIDEGWSLKAMHRLIVHSRTYQQSSGESVDNAAIDVQNTYLWRYPRHRLDAESIRDSLLVLGGNLDRSVGGPHPFPEMRTWNFTQHNPFKAVYETNRRSVYLMTQRIQRHPFLALFDGPDTNASTAHRLTSTTPLQGLFLLNDPFVQEQARRFAARLLREPEVSERVRVAYLLAFGRPPLPEEIQVVLAHAERVHQMGTREEKIVWESVARALLLSNEFVYVD